MGGNPSCSKETKLEEMKQNKSINIKKSPVKEMRGRVAVSRQKLYQESLDHAPNFLTQTFDNEYYLYTKAMTICQTERHRKKTDGILECTQSPTLASPHINSKYSIPNSSIELQSPQEKNNETVIKQKTIPKRKSRNQLFSTATIPHKMRLENGANRIIYAPQKLDQKKIVEENNHVIFDQVSLLPHSVFFKIISYAIDNFRTFLSVNPSWYCSIMDSFDTEFNEIESKFINKYSEYLLFKNSYTTSSFMKFCDINCVRVDRVIRFEPLEKTFDNSIILAYRFKYKQNPHITYRSVFEFDSYGKNQRILWAHLNECNVFFLS